MMLRRALPGDLAAILALHEAAYALNRAITGREPMPLTWDYAEVLKDWQCWVLADAEGLAGLLILQLRTDDLYIENISVAPRAQGRALGKRLMAKAHAEARAAGRTTLRLLTNEKMERNWRWYQREGFAIEMVEDLGNRRVVHMAKTMA